MNLNAGGRISALVQGANGGIGMALTRRLLDEPSVACVHATCRRPGTGLRRLAREAGARLALHSLDLTDETSIRQTMLDVGERSPRHHGPGGEPQVLLPEPGHPLPEKLFVAISVHDTIFIGMRGPVNYAGSP